MKIVIVLYKNIVILSILCYNDSVIVSTFHLGEYYVPNKKSISTARV